MDKSVSLKWNDEIIVEMKNGVNSAFEHCYLILSPTIYTAILKICKDKDIASELLHDTFIDAFENISSFDLSNVFIAWLKRIAFNNTFNYIKKQKSVRLFEDKIESEYPKSIDDNHGDSDLLNKLMALVPATHRLILWLYIVEQYSHDEIAKLFDKSASYSKSIVSRSLIKLREHAEEARDAYK